MSLMDKIKSFFSGGSSTTDGHEGHDHSGDDHSHEPAAPAGMPLGDAAEPREREEERGN
jgi:hypothetical protein